MNRLLHVGLGLLSACSLDTLVTAGQDHYAPDGGAMDGGRGDSPTTPDTGRDGPITGPDRPNLDAPIGPDGSASEDASRFDAFVEFDAARDAPACGISCELDRDCEAALWYRPEWAVCALVIDHGTICVAPCDVECPGACVLGVCDPCL